MNKPNWWQRKPWQLTMIGVAGLLVGFIAGIWGSAAERDSLTEQVHQANGQIAQQADQISQIKQARRQAIESVATDRAALENRAKNLDVRAAKLQAAEQTVKHNTIRDGVWQAGTDFDPGIYRAPGGGTCYWATLGSADTGDITNNGLGKNPTVTIGSGWFETSGCGAWTKIG